MTVWPCACAWPCVRAQASTALADSDILACVPGPARSALLAALPHWLPHKSFTLLYRGARDGLSPAVFHDRCDGAGPTLTLILCEGWVLGGYSSTSWDSPAAKGERPAACVCVCVCVCLCACVPVCV